MILQGALEVLFVFVPFLVIAFMILFAPTPA
jgi:hypothetical protein